MDSSWNHRHYSKSQSFRNTQNNRLAADRADMHATSTWGPERLIRSPVEGRGGGELLASIFGLGRSCMVSKIAREN